MNSKKIRKKAVLFTMDLLDSSNTESGSLNYLDEHSESWQRDSKESKNPSIDDSKNLMKKSGIGTLASFKSRNQLNLNEGKRNVINSEQSVMRIEQMNNMDHNSVEVDAVKEYNYYYPEQNYEVVAEKINRMNEKHLMRKSIWGIFSSFAQKKEKSTPKIKFPLQKKNKFFESAKFKQKMHEGSKNQKTKKKKGGFKFLKWVLGFLGKKSYV